MEFISAEKVGALREENVNEMNGSFIHLTNIYSVPNTHQMPYQAQRPQCYGKQSVSLLPRSSEFISFSKLCTASGNNHCKVTHYKTKYKFSSNTHSFPGDLDEVLPQTISSPEWLPC